MSIFHQLKQLYFSMKLIECRYLTMWREEMRTSDTRKGCVNNTSLEKSSNYFCDLNNNTIVIVKFPKSALNSVAGDLDTLLRDACQLPATEAFWKNYIYVFLTGGCVDQTCPRKIDLNYHYLQKSKTKLMNIWPVQIYLNSSQVIHLVFTDDPLTRRMPCGAE